MTCSTADVVICGAGVSAAYHLAVRHGVRDVVLVDERAPLTLTSDKSTECYRNWWPGPGDAMVSLMNRSIDILEELAHESGNRFHLNRRGYLFVTADLDRIPNLERSAQESSELGAGPVRYHPGEAGGPEYMPAPAQGFEGMPTGSDLILDPLLIREHCPYLSERTVTVVHVRRAGWFSAQQLGMYLLEGARQHGVWFSAGHFWHRRIQMRGSEHRLSSVAYRNQGVRFVSARVEDVEVAGGALKHPRTYSR